METAKIVLLCAYHQEANPLINRLRLRKKVELSAFPIYHNDEFLLIESGPGMIQAASAVGYLAGLSEPRQLAWLNIGIAGHSSLPIGEGRLVNKLTDRQSQTTYFPDCSLDTELQTEALSTFANPQESYLENEMVDMEAAGFFQAALKFSTLEYIQCYKIISDNADNPANKLDRKTIPGIIESHISSINQLIQALIQRVSLYQAIYEFPVSYNQLLDSYHFTQSQKHQLEDITRQWQLFRKDSPIDYLSEYKPSDAKSALQLLYKALEAESAFMLR